MRNRLDAPFEQLACFDKWRLDRLKYARGVLDYVGHARLVLTMVSVLEYPALPDIEVATATGSHRAGEVERRSAGGSHGYVEKTNTA